MSTVYETATLLPDPAEFRSHLRALAVLDATIGDDPRFSCYTFDATWGSGEEAALMDNGSGDDFSVIFTPAGVLIRGFDHESEMSPYGTEDEQVWPGVIDDVPASLSPLLDEPACHDEGIDAPRVTAARTVPDGFLPYVPDEEDSAFEPMLELPADQPLSPR